MNKKFLLALWFVLFAVLIITVNVLLGLPSGKNSTLKNKMDETENYIIRLTALHSSFLYNFNHIDNLFADNTTENEKEALQLFDKVTENLTDIQRSRIINKSKAVNDALNVLIEYLNTFRGSMNDLFMATHELGNQNSGLIAQWREISLRMSNSITSRDAQTLKQIYLIRQLESEYLITRDSRHLSDISVSAEDIRNSATFEEGGIGLNDLDEYLALTSRIMALDKRTGSINSEGVIYDLENSLINTTEQFYSVRDMIINAGNKYVSAWEYVRYSIILMLIVAFVLTLVVMSNRSVFNPLSQLALITENLSKGHLPEDLQFSSELNAMKSIKQHITKIVKMLREKVAFTKALNEGKNNINIQDSGENDILARELIILKEKLTETAEIQIKNETENQIRRYSNEGLAKFSEILRTSSNDIQALGDVIIKEIVKYLNAIQGGFFVFDNTDKGNPVLNLVSAFAYDRKKYLQKSVSLGEGLVGTCAREKQLINMTEIPGGYISITSGLGDTLPDNLLLVPVISEEELIGVIEIASLNKFRDYEMKLAQDVAKNLGSTIVYARNNQRTSDLLAKSQQQALEMAEQEEEMRQNMEELKATQEESHRREEELKGITDAVSNSFSVVEYDLSGNIINVNEKLCVLIGRSLEEIVGKTHHAIFNSDLNPDSSFWNDLIASHGNVLHETILVRDNVIKLKEHFCAVVNRNKAAVKFVNFISDDRTGNS